MKKLLNILTSFSLAIFIICGLGLKFKSLYYYDVKKLNISDVSGFSDDEIKLNYDYLIDYNLNNKVEEFNLPTIKYSTQGKIHFEEANLINYCHGEYYPMTKKSLGSFGYSVRKKKKKK